MSLLDDARQMVKPGIGLHCDFCTGSPKSGHLEGCPVLSMPRFVAALEAAEKIAYEHEHPTHPDDLWLGIRALVAALKGES